MIEIGIADCFDMMGEGARGRRRGSRNWLCKRLTDKTGLRCGGNRRTNKWNLQHLAARNLGIPQEHISQICDCLSFAIFNISVQY